MASDVVRYALRENLLMSKMGEGWELPLVPHERAWERPREILKEITPDELELLKRATLTEILEYVHSNPDDAAKFILEKDCKNVNDMLNWICPESIDDEGIDIILGFWPWKDDPIPATEVGLEVEDV